MFCPNCGDDRAGEVRFCPRCGFRLDGVAELLAHNGVLPGAAPPQTPEPSVRRKAIRQGAQIMFFSVVMLPVFGLLCVPADNPAPLIAPLTVFLAGLARALYGKLFYDDYSPGRQAHNPAAPRQMLKAQRADTTNRLAQASDARSPRRKGIKRGQKIMFLSGVLLPIFMGISIAADDGGPLLAPLAVFMAGLFWLLYHRLFSEDTVPAAAPAFAPPQMAPTYQPPMPSLNAPQPDLADALHPPSVLEHTTRNLESVPRTPQSQNPSQ